MAIKLMVLSDWAGDLQLELPSRIRQVVVATMNRLSRDYPMLSGIDVLPGDPVVMDNILATKSVKAVYLHPNYWMDRGELKKHAKEWDGLVVDASISGVIIHEVGHILDGMVLRKLGSKKYNALLSRHLRDLTGIWNDESPSPYGQENVAEYVAEAFSAYYLNKMLVKNQLGVTSLAKSKALWAEMNAVLGV